MLNTYFFFSERNYWYVSLSHYFYKTNLYVPFVNPKNFDMLFEFTNNLNVFTGFLMQK